MATHEQPVTVSDYGLLARYDDVNRLKTACECIRDAGYTHWDVHSPFPVHGLDPAMGIRPTRLPYLFMAMGALGCASAVLMQWWMNVVDYPYVVSGKPLFSLPANIPIVFEVTVLFAAVTAFIVTLARNGLPRHHHPLFNSKAFRRATDDHFFIAIEAKDPRYNELETRELLEGTLPVSVEKVKDDSKVDAKIPRPIMIALVTVFAAGLVPLGVIARSWYAKSDKPRIHLNPNMDWQKKYKAQNASSFFLDGRAMRPEREETVSVGHKREDPALYWGLDESRAWLTSLPPQIERSEATMKRGQERFNIYCSPCHGHAGYGNGMVARRAEATGQQAWVPPSSLHQDAVVAQPNGKLFDTITHGIRNMPAYGHAIPVKDRWAIVMYIRALQRSQRADIQDVPVEDRARLR